MPNAFIASIAGSSWNSADTSGLAPIRSPAPTVIVLEFSSRSCLMCVARYSIPPAGTVFAAQPVWTPELLLTGLQQPVWIEPGVFGARCPWRSLIARSWTYVSLSFFGPFGRECLRRAEHEHEPERREHGNGPSHVRLPFFRFP